MADEETDDTGDGNEQVTMTRAEFNAQLAKARRGGEQRVVKREQSQQQDGELRLTIGQFAQLREALGIQAPAASTEAKPAASATSPNRVEAIRGPAGSLNIFNLNESELAQLGPHALREHFEGLLAAGDRANGRPRRPLEVDARGNKLKVNR